MPPNEMPKANSTTANAAIEMVEAMAPESTSTAHLNPGKETCIRNVGVTAP